MTRKRVDVFFVFKLESTLTLSGHERQTQGRGVSLVSPLDLGNARKRLDLDTGLVVGGLEVAGRAGVD